MNDLEDAFGIVEQSEPVAVEQPSREQQLTELHQVKADALATVRPLRELTVDTHGLAKVKEGRKAVVKLRTSVDKRRKLLNEEAKKWIDLVNGTAKEILSIIEPVEMHLKGQEALHESRQRQAEEAERQERVALRRAAWPANAGPFPEFEAGNMSAVDWQGLVFTRSTQQQAAPAPRVFDPIIPAAEPVVLPVSEGVGRMAAEIRVTWRDATPEPVAVAFVTPAKPGPSAESRLAELIESLREIIRMRGEVDWRGLITEAITDATR